MLQGHSLSSPSEESVILRIALISAVFSKELLASTVQLVSGHFISRLSDEIDHCLKFRLPAT